MSTLSQLLSHWDNILDGLEQGNGVDSVYLDFSKASSGDRCPSTKAQGCLSAWQGRMLVVSNSELSNQAADCGGRWDNI